jgi:hypothetical protein
MDRWSRFGRMLRLKSEALRCTFHSDLVNFHVFLSPVEKFTLNDSTAIASFRYLSRTHEFGGRIDVS